MSRVWKLTNLSWNKIPTALSTKREALSYDIQWIAGSGSFFVIDQPN